MAGNTIPIKGTAARLRYGTAGSGTLVTYTLGWTMDCKCNTMETTPQGASWDTFLADVGAWTASLELELCLGDASQLALLNSLLTTPGTVLSGATALSFDCEDTGDYFTGSSIVSNFQITARKKDIVKGTINVQGTGALSLTVA